MTTDQQDRQNRLIKRWEDNIREWTALQFSKSQRAVDKKKKKKRKKERKKERNMKQAATTPEVKG